MTFSHEMPILRVVETKSNDYFRPEPDLLKKLQSEGKHAICQNNVGFTSLPASHPHTTFTGSNSHLVHWPTRHDGQIPVEFLSHTDIMSQRHLLEEFESHFIEPTAINHPHALFYFLLGHAPKIESPDGEKYIQGGPQSLKPRHCHQLTHGVLNPHSTEVYYLHRGDRHYNKTLAAQSNLGPQHAQSLLSNELKTIGVPIKITNQLGVNANPLVLEHTAFGFNSLYEAYLAAEKFIGDTSIIQKWASVRKAVASYNSSILPGIKYMVHQIPSMFLVRPSQKMNDTLEASKKMTYWLLPFFYSFSLLEQPGGITVVRNQSNLKPNV